MTNSNFPTVFGRDVGVYGRITSLPSMFALNTTHDAVLPLYLALASSNANVKILVL